MALTAADIMTKPAIFVAPESALADVAKLLADRHISAVPVCQADGTLLGLVSEAEILKPFRESVLEKRDWWLGMLAEGSDLSEDFLAYLRRDTRSADAVMVREVITTNEDATVPEMAELMTSHRVKRLPVLRDGRVIGVVSRADLVAAIARSPSLI